MADRYAPGQTVRVDSDILGRVRLTRFGYGESCTYLVMWWHDGKLVEEWVDHAELTDEQHQIPRLRVETT